MTPGRRVSAFGALPNARLKWLAAAARASGVAPLTGAMQAGGYLNGTAAQSAAATYAAAMAGAGYLSGSMVTVLAGDLHIARGVFAGAATQSLQAAIAPGENLPPVRLRVPVTTGAQPAGSGLGAFTGRNSLNIPLTGAQPGDVCVLVVQSTDAGNYGFDAPTVYPAGWDSKTIPMNSPVNAQIGALAVGVRKVAAGDAAGANITAFEAIGWALYILKDAGAAGSIQTTQTAAAPGFLLASKTTTAGAATVPASAAVLQVFANTSGGTPTPPAQSGDAQPVPQAVVNYATAYLLTSAQGALAGQAVTWQAAPEATATVTVVFPAGGPAVTQSAAAGMQARAAMLASQANTLAVQAALAATGGLYAGPLVSGLSASLLGSATAAGAPYAAVAAILHVGRGEFSGALQQSVQMQAALTAYGNLAGAITAAGATSAALQGAGTLAGVLRQAQALAAGMAATGGLSAAQNNAVQVSATLAAAAYLAGSVQQSLAAVLHIGRGSMAGAQVQALGGGFGGTGYVAGALGSATGAAAALRATAYLGGALRVGLAGVPPLTAPALDYGALQADPARLGNLQANPARLGNLQANPARLGNLQANPARLGAPSVSVDVPRIGLAAAARRRWRFGR